MSTITKHMGGLEFRIRFTGESGFPYAVFYVASNGLEIQISEVRRPMDAYAVIRRWLSM